ncbi:MAG: nitrophenyl compound nitroreductase subunit ArsF family protein [Bacteroidales bacterium]|nr:nitrophenyl compound nitroreductase subunit ArsF family protein [Bacteroidales bacterium]
MRRFFTLGLLLMIFFGSCSGNSQEKGTKNDSDVAVLQSNDASKVELIYFHYTRRCITCKAVEDNSKAAFEALYSDKIKSGNYSYKSLNLDEAEGKSVASKHKVEGQALVVVINDKVVDITGQAFLNSKSVPKIQGEIKKAVDKATVK